MKLRFFHVESDIVHHANRSRVLGAWERRKPWDQSQYRSNSRNMLVRQELRNLIAMLSCGLA